MSYADIFSEPDSSSDLGITLLGAALLHIVLILGLTFSLPKKPLHDDAPQPRLNTSNSIPILVCVKPKLLPASC